jgi:hypothetical protein
MKIYLKERDCEVVDWIQLAHDRVQWRALVNMLMCIQVPKRRELSCY